MECWWNGIENICAVVPHGTSVTGDWMANINLSPIYLGTSQLTLTSLTLLRADSWLSDSNEVASSSVHPHARQRGGDYGRTHGASCSGRRVDAIFPCVYSDWATKAAACNVCDPPVSQECRNHAIMSVCGVSVWNWNGCVEFRVQRVVLVYSLWWASVKPVLVTRFIGKCRASGAAIAILLSAGALTGVDTVSSYELLPIVSSVDGV